MTPWESVRPYFERGAVVHLATLLPDGAPHSVPVWVGLEGDRIGVFMVERSRKDRNLRRDPRVALSVTRPDQPLDMAAVRGRATERLTGEAAMAVVDRISRLYTGEPYDVRTGLVAHLIDVERAWALDHSEGAQ